MEEEAPPILPQLPVELWDMIFAFATAQNEDTNETLLIINEDEKDPEWKQLATLMLVCREWRDMVWAHVREIDCRGEHSMPLSYALKVALPLAGSHLSEISLNLHIISDSDDEEEEDSEDENKKKKRKKELTEEEKRKKEEQKRKEAEHKATLALVLKDIPIMCPYLSNLWLGNKVEGVSSLFDNIPTTWRESLRELQVCTLLDSDLQKICEGPNALTSLTALNLRSSDSLSNEAVGKCLPKLTSLTKLDIASCKALKEDTFVKIFPALSSLTSLSAGWSDVLKTQRSADAIASCIKLKVTY